MSDTNGVEADQSPQLNELAAALAKAQGAMRHATKDATNPHFKSRYADLASAVDALREPLANNGLSYVQLVSNTTDGVMVTTQLMHSSGQWVRGRLSMPVAQRTPQALGSAITYARRYSLMAMVGIAPDDDDDGNAATAPRAETQGRRTTEASARQSRTEALKEKLAKPAEPPPAPPPTPSGQVTAKLSESVEAMTRISALQEQYGLTGARMASILKGATGKANRAQLTLEDVEKVAGALDAMIDAEEQQ